MRILLAWMLWFPFFIMPGGTLDPQPTPFPTPIEVAEEFTFTNVGETRWLLDYRPYPPEFTGKVIVAGLQTIILKELWYRGPFPASIMLIKGDCCDPYHGVELYRITGTLRDAFILVHQPAKLRHEMVDSIVICANGEAVATTGAFPPPRRY